MRKSFLLISFFSFTPILLFISIIFLSFLIYTQRSSGALLGKQLQKVSFAALPSIENTVISRINQKDARSEIIRQFFEKYNSPLEPFSQDIIKASDKYSLDFRLLPAIAMQESNLCQKILFNSHNCWGFGMYGKTITKFTNYKEAIDTVTKTLALEYKEKRRLETPKEIMSRYTPGNNGAWAYSVNYFMSTLQ